MAGNGDGNYGRALSYGLEIAVGATMGYLVGSWYDRHHGSAPWGLLIGVMLGLAAGMYLLIKDAISMNKD